MITKAEVRAVTLARLQPLPTDVAWDIGAGSGAVSVEWGRLLSRGMVYAVERDGQTFARLQTNVHDHRAYNVVPIHAEAPACMAELPDPDGVFIGGSGGQLTAILSAALKRLRPGGRVVANFILLEHVHEAQQWAKVAWLGGGYRLAVNRPQQSTRRDDQSGAADAYGHSEYYPRIAVGSEWSNISTARQLQERRDTR